MNSVHCGWHCVRRIINDRNAQRLGQLIDSPHVARASAEVDRHNGSGSRCYRRGNFVGVYTERLAINVDEHDFGAEMANNFRRRCERKGWNNDFVAWPDAQGFENKVHSARVGCHRDGTNISSDKFCKTCSNDATCGPVVSQPLRRTEATELMSSSSSSSRKKGTFRPASTRIFPCRDAVLQCKPCQGRILRIADHTLPYGRVIYDYLEES